MKKLLVFAVAALLAFAPAMEASTPLNANTTVAISLTVAVTETLTVTATPSSVNFNGTSGMVSGSSPITVTTSYQLNPAVRSNITLYAYTDSPNALIGPGGSTFILPSNVFASVNGGGFQACNNTDNGISGGTECLGSGGLQLANSNSNASVWPSGNVNTTIALQIQLGANPAFGTYTGTLHITAQAV